MPTGLRERKKEATRQAIADAALRLAAEDGPDAVTVGEIAEAADVSERTFFNYFATKEESFFAVRPGRASEVAEAFAARPPDESVLRSLREALLGSEDFFTEHAWRWTRRLELVRAHPNLLAAYVASYRDIERALVEAVATRVGEDPDDDQFPALAVGLAVTALRTTLTSPRNTGDPARLRALIDEAFTILEGGVTHT